MSNRKLSENKIKYIDFCQNEHNLPIFIKNWWLDAACGAENWDVSLSFDSEGQINGVLPYNKVYLKKIFSAIVMPELTPHTGIWFKMPHKPNQTLKPLSENTIKKEILTTLIEGLPEMAFYHQKFHFSMTDWLPFYWKNFNGSTHYTYIFDNIGENLTDIFNNFKGSVRTDIRKAEKTLFIEKSDDLEALYDLVHLSFVRQGMTPSFSFQSLKNIDAAIKAQNENRQILFAKDNSGRIHSAIYVVYDKNSAHYLVGGSDTHLRQSGALPLLIWQAIQDAAALGKSEFNFEGSMLPQIEFAFRNFGATPKPFFRITRQKNRFYEFLALFFRNYK